MSTRILTCEKCESENLTKLDVLTPQKKRMKFLPYEDVSFKCENCNHIFIAQQVTKAARSSGRYLF